MNSYEVEFLKQVLDRHGYGSVAQAIADWILEADCGLDDVAEKFEELAK